MLVNYSSLNHIVANSHHFIGVFKHKVTTQHSIIQIFLQIVQFVKTGRSYLVLKTFLLHGQVYQEKARKRSFNLIYASVSCCKKPFPPRKCQLKNSPHFNNSATRSTCKNMHVKNSKLHLWCWGQIWSFWSLHGQVCQEETWKKGPKEAFIL